MPMVTIMIRAEENNEFKRTIKNGAIRINKVIKTICTFFENMTPIVITFFLDLNSRIKQKILRIRIAVKIRADSEPRMTTQDGTAIINKMIRIVRTFFVNMKYILVILIDLNISIKEEMPRAKPSHALEKNNDLKKYIDVQIFSYPLT